MTSDAVSLMARADQCAQARDFAEARRLLTQVVAVQPSVDNFLKLGAMCRAGGDFPAALGAVHSALILAPLHFMALMSRASLLERMGVDESGEAFGQALAQKPQGEVSPQLAQIIAQAERSYEAYVQQRDHKLVAAMAPAMLVADDEETRRIDRFRSNALRRTRPFHCEPTHFHFPGLVEREFHSRDFFPWLTDLEAATDVIAAEFETVSKAERSQLVPYIQYAEHAPLAQWEALNHSDDWTAIHLMQNGLVVGANAQHCPQTMALLKTIPQPDIAGCSPNAMFSLLAPETIIPPHTGVANTRLVCHLPLIVPEGCWFRVGAETRQWERGKAFVFDDTIEHEAANPSPFLRVVFIIDIWNPELSACERDAVRLMMEADATGVALAL